MRQRELCSIDALRTESGRRRSASANPPRRRSEAGSNADSFAVLGRRRNGRSPRAGITIIETMIGLTILALVLVNISTVVRTSTDVYQSGALLNQLEDQAQQAMERLVYAVISTRAEDLPIPPPPLSVSALDYEVLLGVEDGNDIWGDPSRIEFVVPDGQIVWRQNPGSDEEMRVVWSNWVPELFRDEIPNGEDDNGNALFDEAGLSFGMEDGQVTIRLMLRRTDDRNTVYTRTLESRVTCRN